MKKYQKLRILKLLRAPQNKIQKILLRRKINPIKRIVLRNMKIMRIVLTISLLS